MRPCVSARSLVLLSCVATVCLAPAPDIDAPHASNAVYQAMLRDGVTLDGTRIAFPPPLLKDNDTPEAEQGALRTLAGSDAKLQELLRNAVTAPQIVRLHDEKAGDATLIRVAEVYFAVHARLEEIDPAQLGGRSDGGKPIEAGNMRFSNRLLADLELKQRGITREDPKLDWYTHVAVDLLDRISVEATDHVRGTASERSWVFASRTDPRFDDDTKYPNRWRGLGRVGQAQAPAEPRRYAGGASMTRISRLASLPGVLFVEGHFVFAEPRTWFDGAPILRSKITLVAQDQIRRLRRDLAQRKSQAPR